MTTGELKLPMQSPLATRMGRATAAQVTDRLTDREVETFDVRGVRTCGAFRLIGGFLQSRGRADNALPLQTRYAVLSPMFDDLCVDAANAKEIARGGFVETETIGHHQRRTNDVTERKCIVE